MKDVASCDKLRQDAHSLRPADVRMGEPSRSHYLLLPTEYIGWVETTWRTETSKYPEEEKSTEIPVVAASEPGPSLNPCIL